MELWQLTAAQASARMAAGRLSSERYEDARLLQIAAAVAAVLDPAP